MMIPFMSGEINVPTALPTGLRRAWRPSAEVQGTTIMTNYIYAMLITILLASCGGTTTADLEEGSISGIEQPTNTGGSTTQSLADGGSTSDGAGGAGGQPDAAVPTLPHSNGGWSPSGECVVLTSTQDSILECSVYVDADGDPDNFCELNVKGNCVWGWWPHAEGGAACATPTT